MVAWGASWRCRNWNSGASRAASTVCRRAMLSGWPGPVSCSRQAGWVISQVLMDASSGDWVAVSNSHYTVWLAFVEELLTERDLQRRGVGRSDQDPKPPALAIGDGEAAQEGHRAVGAHGAERERLRLAAAGADPGFGRGRGRLAGALYRYQQHAAGPAAQDPVLAGYFRGQETGRKGAVVDLIVAGGL